MVFGQNRLGVKGVDVRDATGHKEKDDILALRSEVMICDVRYWSRVTLFGHQRGQRHQSKPG